MKFSSPYLRRLAGFSVATILKRWLSTVDYRIAHYDPTADTGRHDTKCECIFVSWHEYLLAPLHLRGRSDLALLMSRHRDASWLAEATSFLGFDCVRGSTARGGAKAVMELRRVLQNRSVAITPDGPRGPRREMAAGSIFLASRLGLPIVVVGTGYDKFWRLKTWDRFVLPRPFARGRLVMGPRMHIPADLDRDGIEHYRLQVQQLLQCLTAEAEAWATAGTHKLQEMAMPPHKKPLHCFPELARQAPRVKTKTQTPEVPKLSIHRAAA